MVTLLVFYSFSLDPLPPVNLAQLSFTTRVFVLHIHLSFLIKILMLDPCSPASILLFPTTDKGILIFVAHGPIPASSVSPFPLTCSGFQMSSFVHIADIFALNGSSENSSAEHGYPISNFSSTLGCKIPSLPISTSFAPLRLASVPDPCPSVAR